ncbi:MAG: LCP family protein [Bacillota bacterium]
MAEDERRPKKRLKARSIVIICILICLVGGIGYGTVQNFYFKQSVFPGRPGGEPTAQAAEDKKINFLILGSDARYGEEWSRSDSMMFVSADTHNKRMVFLSIPRDTLVSIPGHGRERINAAMAYGGPELAVDVVSELIDQQIDYYVVTNYEGFIKLVDALGGITLYVDKNMRHYDPERGGRFSINLTKGLQELDGEKALMYVRFRGDPLGDINRVDRQQKFLRAVAEEMLKPANIIKIPVLLPKIKKCIYTNLPFADMMDLAKLAKSMQDVEMVSGTLPGYLGSDPYWHVDPDEARRAVAQLLSGESIQQVVKDTPAGVIVMQIDQPEEPSVSESGYDTVAGEGYGSETPSGMDVEIIPGDVWPGGDTIQEPPDAADQGNDQGELPPIISPGGQLPETTPPPSGTADDVYSDI